MSLRRSTAWFALPLLLAAGSAAAQGATSDSSRVPVACTYRTCALRVESAIFSSPRLVRGAMGESIGDHLTIFGGGIDPLLTGPDSATANARAYVTNTKRSAVLGILGIASYIVTRIRLDNDGGRDPSPGTVVAAVASVGFAIASIPFAVRAQRQLSRAIWWYNEALPR